MNLISCDKCGVVLDKDKLKFPANIWLPDGSLNPETVEWNGVDHAKKMPCPVCCGEILDNQNSWGVEASEPPSRSDLRKTSRLERFEQRYRSLYTNLVYLKHRIEKDLIYDGLLTQVKHVLEDFDPDKEYTELYGRDEM